MNTQFEKAKLFRDLHAPQNPLVIYNIWDAGSAKVAERAGAKAIATGSWSVAAAQGYTDGEELPLDAALAVVERIVHHVNLPVTVDFEGGYAIDPSTIEQNVRRLLALGVIGLNFEDQVVKGQGLYRIEEQVARLRAVRNAADGQDVPVFLNARTDLFLKATLDVDHESLLDEAVTRAAAYAGAGADGFFVPGLTDKELIRRLCKKVMLPVNVMIADPKTIRDLAACGVSRISFGPNPYVSLTRVLEGDVRVCLKVDTP